MKRAIRLLLVLALLAAAWYVWGDRAQAEGVAAAPPPEIVFGCFHMWNSRIECPELPNPQEAWIDIERVRAMRLGFLIDGEWHDWEFGVDLSEDGMSNNIDAIFLTRHSLWKIWRPYMESIVGPDSTMTWWELEAPRRR